MLDVVICDMTDRIQKTDIHLNLASREMAIYSTAVPMWAAAIRRTRGGAPWSLNGSKSVVEVAPISYPSGKCNFNVFPGSYPYPYLLPGIRIFRISRESHRVATRSHRLQLRAVE